MKSAQLLAVLFAAHLLLGPALALRISAFNIKAFGDKKMSDEAVSEIIVRIVSNYDLVLIQEVRDADLSAVKKLVGLLNRASAERYGYVASQPLGRSTYKEQYLFLYREDQVSVADSYLYDDGCEPCGNDTFSREPFVVKFVAPHTEVKELVLVPLHTPPSDAVAEIDALYDVYLDVIDKWGTHDVLFLGDFNADCAYVRPEDWPHIRLRTHSSFQWLTPDTADTTVATTTDCAYDRIVAAGPKLRGAAVPGTARVYDFQKAFGLSYKEASAVSDHFPVEVTLKSL
ncbi:deoxyribonuclease-1-like [Paroedura picta]|uniref:deoxyribonuclease-1-like n=1 Tax=Paroedura picta TaxID=143630 RepID=UPI00405730A4